MAKENKSKITPRTKELTVMLLVAGILVVAIVGGISAYFAQLGIDLVANPQTVGGANDVPKVRQETDAAKIIANQQIVDSLITFQAANIGDSSLYRLVVMRSIGDNLPKALILNTSTSTVVGSKNIKQTMTPDMFDTSPSGRYVAFVLNNLGGGCASTQDCAALQFELQQSEDDWGVWIFDTVEQDFEHLGSLWTTEPGKTLGSSVHGIKWNPADQLEYFLYTGTRRVGATYLYDPITTQTVTF